MATDCEYDMNRLNHIGDDLVAAFNDGYAHGKADAERKRGEWIRVTEELGESWMCSECMEEFIPHDGMEEFASYAHFCPNCGAKMESGGA